MVDTQRIEMIEETIDKQGQQIVFHDTRLSVLEDKEETEALRQTVRELIDRLPDKDMYVTRVEFDEFKAQFNTLQDLVVGIHKTQEAEFAAISEQFARIDERFDRQDERFARQDARLDKQDARLDKQDARLDTHDLRLERIEAKLVEHDLRFERIEAKLAEHDERFEAIESQLGRIEKLLLAMQ